LTGFGKLDILGYKMSDMTIKTDDEYTEEFLKKQIETLNEINDAIRDAVERSGQNIDPDNYFIWMYSVEPFAEA
jgi:hypothetical protein|tara:strand:- start:164 stop:385 length:222 start_codon:yes stop_codon:yes gene_type:complete